jgi:hypothetical protein
MLPIFGIALVSVYLKRPAQKSDRRRPASRTCGSCCNRFAIEQKPSAYLKRFVITEAEIKKSNAKSIPDLLRTEEGILVRNLLGNGKNAQVDLRGYGESAPYNTLVLIDGRRVNSIDLSGVDWTQIPIDSIARIEIVRGTGSVMYGDNAVGGVINIITRLPSKNFDPMLKCLWEAMMYPKDRQPSGWKQGSAALDRRFSATKVSGQTKTLKPKTYRQNVYDCQILLPELGRRLSLHVFCCRAPEPSALAADAKARFPLGHGDSEDSLISGPVAGGRWGMRARSRQPALTACGKVMPIFLIPAGSIPKPSIMIPPPGG